MELFTAKKKRKARGPHPFHAHTFARRITLGGGNKQKLAEGVYPYDTPRNASKTHRFIETWLKKKEGKKKKKRR